jgi:hypothetical protein
MYGETCGSHSDVKTFRSLVYHQGRMETRQVTQNVGTYLPNCTLQQTVTNRHSLYFEPNVSCGETWWYIYCPLTNTPCSTATPECVTLRQIHIAVSVPFRSWCHNPNAGVNSHWYCYQRYRSRSMHCSSSHSTLTASCHIGWTYCSPAESLIISVKRKTCFIMLYQLVLSMCMNNMQ